MGDELMLKTFKRNISGCKQLNDLCVCWSMVIFVSSAKTAYPIDMRTDSCEHVLDGGQGWTNPLPTRGVTRWRCGFFVRILCALDIYVSVACGSAAGRWTCDLQVVGSIPGRWLPRNIDQLSLASLRGR